MTRMCPPEHPHDTNTTCYHSHGCRCEPCHAALRVRARARRRKIAYRTHEGLVDPTGTRRRIHGLHRMGWRLSDIAEVAGLAPRRISQIQVTDAITPRVRDLIIGATETLVRRGLGPSEQTRKRSAANGMVPLLAWNDIDRDPEPVQLERQSVIRANELIDEIDHLVSLGESPDHIAKALNRSAGNLERHAYRFQRNDLASMFNQAAKREAA